MKSTLPAAFQERMQLKLPGESDFFFDALEQKTPVSFRLNNSKSNYPPTILSGDLQAIPWATAAYYLSERPSFIFDPFFHAGSYYVQEASSMFIEELVKQHIQTDQSLKVLDLCAAPGGKSTHLLSMINDNSILISNEVIGSRATILAENMTRWGRSNVVVTNNDPEHFLLLENCFDLVLVDAPCSGEGMFRKDPNAMNEWSENHVQLCSSRQKRILEQAASLVRPGGHLIYSTCTYNEEENEQQVLRLCEEQGFCSLKTMLDPAWGITESIPKADTYTYRFYPHKTRGEGFFAAILQKPEEGTEGHWPRPSKKISLPSKKSIEVVKKYLEDPSGLCFIQHKEQVLAIPTSVADEMTGLLNTSLHIRLFGTDLGQVMHEELIPAHAFALSLIRKKTLPGVSLGLDDAIAYLQKKDIKIPGYAKGWYLIDYMGAVIGWAKILPNRVNNSYPKEWRIRKESVED